jgi:hypothetical protein
MTPEELAVWVDENRKALRRDAQWACDCSRRTKPIAAVYLDGDGRALFWTAGRQRLAQDGTVENPRARAVNITELVMSGADLLEFAQCRRCRRSLVFTLHEGDLRMVAQLDPPKRAVVTD